MRYIILVASIIMLASCVSAPKKEYEYILESGELAPPEEVARVKEVCNYDTKVQASKDNLSIAISIGRYETNTYGPKKSDQYVKNAARFMSEARSCLIENGLRTREKIKA